MSYSAGRVCLRYLAVFGGFILIGSGLTAAQAPRQEVFRLGRFDGSSYEFSQGEPQGPVRVHPSKPGATEGWFAFQPEITPEAAGPNCESPAARSIAFPIHGAPASYYRVRVALLFEHASVPALCVNINGQKGEFYPAPTLDRRMGDGGGVSWPEYSQNEISFLIPGVMLHDGENTIAFTAISSDASPQVPDAGFNYDAIDMTEAGVPAEQTPMLRLKPTIFYRQHDRRLQERIDIIIRARGDALHKASIMIGSTRAKLPINDGATWGEQKFSIFVPAFDTSKQARIELDTGRGREQRSIKITPAKRWTLFVVPHVHFDLGYTDYQAKVASVQSRIVDEALDLIDLHPDFRFSLDGFWSMDQFLASRTLADQRRAFSALTAGKLFVPAQYSNELTGFASAEALFRSLYPSSNFAAKHGLLLNYANITDVPSYSWSYASVLASAGIHQLVAGSNNGRAPILIRGNLDENSPFLWEGPDGKKIVMWYSRHYHQMWTLFGLPPLVSAGEQTLPLFLQMYQRTTYLANSALIYGSQVENTDLFPQQASLVQEWNRRYQYPHLEYSGFHQALSTIAGQFHGRLPTFRGDGGPYWEDGIAADALFAAMERDTEARAPSAEKLATISSLQNSRIAVDMDTLHRLWKQIILMDEHTWLSSRSFTDSQNDEATVQLAYKDAHAQTAHLITDTLLRRSMADLADSINIGPNNLVVFNPLNWRRDGVVSVDLDKRSELVDNVTGKLIPAQYATHGDYTERATFLAQDIPALGYRTYTIRKRQQQTPVPHLIGNTIENAFYRIELDPSTGSIRTIFDKQLHRELVDISSRYRFGQYLYVTTDKSDLNHPRFVPHGATNGKIVSIAQTPLGMTAVLESSDVMTPSIRTTVTLLNGKKRIEITEELNKKGTRDDEGVYFAFPFAMKSPSFSYEIQNGAVNPAHDMLPGAGLDWFSVQHWVAVQQAGVSAAIFPLDAPLVTFGDISRQDFPTQFGQRDATIFSYAMNNYWHTNYRAEQQGAFRFRYVITSAPRTDEVSLSRQGWEESTPLEVDEVTPSDKAVRVPRPLKATEASFLQIDDPALVLEAWKPAEDGRGTILRFLDLGGPDRKVHVRFPHLAVDSAFLTDGLEHNQSSIPIASDGGINFSIEPHAFATIRIVSRTRQTPACGRYCSTPDSSGPAR